MSENKVLLFTQKVKSHMDDAIECHERLGGLLRYYRPERFAWEGGAGCPLVSVELARGVCAEIPRFFWSVRPTIGIHGNSNVVFFGNRW